MDIQDGFQEIIKRSHKRSKGYGIETTQTYPAKVLKGNDFNYQINLNKDLIEVTAPIIKKLLNAIKESGFIIVLTDSKGLILLVFGDDDTIKLAADLQMKPGAFMNEESIGTNAMGTAIAENLSVQITANEHYISAYHNWTCSAAPIHFENEIIGTLNLTGIAENIHPHTLGLIIAAVDAIEFNLKNIKIQDDLKSSNQFAFAMMNNLSYGTFAINLNDEIIWVNDTACRLINIRRRLLINKKITQFFPQWLKVLRIILNDLQYYDQEGKFSLEALNEKYIFNALLIKKDNKELLGYLLTFRPMSRAMNLVKKYSGLQAFFCFEDIIANSIVMKQLLIFAKSVAKSPSTILISGESGTGKEVFAQAIHNESLRKDSVFVAINCGAISPSLIESELFGYEEGAFTGARKGGKPGKFEIADGGTIFLDEIGDMPLDMQVKLLRVLQEGFITRVGGQENIKIDVRIIAATNKNLLSEIVKGNFRLDLFYRLNVIPIRIPSLSERKEDILPLANHFLALKAVKLNKPMLKLNSEVTNYITSYNWPGNVRELENYIEKIVNLDGNISLAEFNELKNNQINDTDVSHDIYNIKTLKDLEKDAIIEAIKISKKNMSLAAKYLGIGRNTLYDKIKKYNIILS